MAKEIYRSTGRKTEKPERYLALGYFNGEAVNEQWFRFKWVAILLAWMRREDYDVVVYDTKED